MSRRKKTALVVCPGRGTYNKAELGYLKHHHADKQPLIAAIDAYREAEGQEPVSALDGRARYSLGELSRGDNASPLIYACAYADFLSIDRDVFEVVAVTGNSMGWYIALACAAAAGEMDALRIVNTMGRLMQDSLIGGQLIYPLVDENWREVPGRRAELLASMAQINGEPDQALYLSIELGGLMVFGGNAPALAALEAALPPEQERYPLRLANHAAFHTPLQQPIAARGRELLDQSLFRRPDLPLIDGRGKIWTPFASDPAELRNYTLGQQVVTPYDFTRAIQVGVKEFAPEALIILGPGTTLGGATAQALIAIGWQGLTSKADFIARQKEDPAILAMGMAEQRSRVVASL